MGRISRLVVLTTALASLCGALSSTAGAVTWTNDGDEAFTATGGAGTFSIGALNFACLGSDGEGTAPVTSNSATYRVSGTFNFTNCTLAGSPTSFECGYVLTATTLATSIATGNLDVTCGLYVMNTKLCHIEGAVHAQYINPTTTTTTPGSLTTTTGNWTLTGASCPFGANQFWHVTALRFNVTGPNRGPFITRNP